MVGLAESPCVPVVPDTQLLSTADLVSTSLAGSPQALSVKCGFSELGDLLEPRRRGISPKLLAVIQCVRRWQRAGFRPKNGSPMTGTDAELHRLYDLCALDQEDI